MSPKRLALATAVVCAFVAIAADAHAASGVVRGRLKFFQNQGNFCPSLSERDRDCTGSRYTERSFHADTGIRNVRVFVKNQKSGSIIGQGTTDSSGSFTVSWSSKAAVTQASIFWEPEQKDGRFRVLTLSGSAYQHPGWQQQPLTSGTTAAAPQTLGTKVWGSLAAPYAIANVTDGATRMWNSNLGRSALMVASFTGLKIHTFTDPKGSECKTSCASGGGNFIKLDAGAPFKPQARVAHEMGHIAAYKANTHRSLASYCWPEASCGRADSGWGMNSSEWLADSFEEGIATFLGDASLWTSSSVDPRTCNSVSYCTGHPIEASPGAACDTSPKAPEFRRPISVIRYLWDVHDSVVDSAKVCRGGSCVTRTDNLSRTVADVLDVYHAYASRFGDHGDDEPFDKDFWGNWEVDDRDGRSGEDFNHNFYKKLGVSAADQWEMNCQP